MRRSVARLVSSVSNLLSNTTRHGPSASSLERSLAESSLSFDAWCADFRHEPRLYSTIAEHSVEYLRKAAPTIVQSTCKAADAIVAHRFDLLGSGTFVPRDPERAVSADGYAPIDWHLDPVRNLRFPRAVPHREWNLEAMRPANADIKYPWELGRCQHWPVLGQAWQLTKDHRYAKEIANQLDDFMEANAVGLGVNWVCTMDVALRAANWAIALDLIKACSELDDRFWRRGSNHLFDHGTFIFANLENKYEVTSNHFLSNVVGLYFVAALYRETAPGRDWQAFCRSALEHEMAVQVLADGADYESSVPYHRLVTELFLGGARLAEFLGEPLSDRYRAKLASMIEFLAATLRPDGLMPQIGDADDGRLHILSGYGAWNPQDPRHVFGPASLMLNEPRWRAYCDRLALWESAWWGFPPQDLAFGERRMPDAARLFPDAGIAVVRRGACYLAVTNGIVGTKGFGNHKHNDQLGFEFHARGIPLFVDPGSFVYTSDAETRNLFRGTAYHNTVCVDGIEQNELRPEWLFRLFETAHPEHIAFAANGTTATYHGRHNGFNRLASPVTHERLFRLHLPREALYVRDRLLGQGTHVCRWHFHLAPGVSAVRVAEDLFMLEAHGQRFALVLSESLDGDASAAWYSRSYGSRVECEAINVERKLHIDGEWTIDFAVAPDDADTGSDVRRLLATLREAKNI